MAERIRRDELAEVALGFGLTLKAGTWRQSFPPTVLDALKGSEQDSMEYFARRYGTPIYCYFRRHGVVCEDAQDLTQAFITDKIVQGNLISNFNPGQHRFRSYLVTAVRNYLVDWIRRERRKPMVQIAPILEDDPAIVAEVEGDAARQLECEIAHEQIRQALFLVHWECERDGLTDHFTMFCRRHFADPRPTWEEVGREFGVSWQVAKNKAWTVRERLRKAMLEEFRMQGMTDGQVLDEIRELQGMFCNYTGSELFSEDWMK